jgi:hypothetical protein
LFSISLRTRSISDFEYFDSARRLTFSESIRSLLTRSEVFRFGSKANLQRIDSVRLILISLSTRSDIRFRVFRFGLLWTNEVQLVDSQSRAGICFRFRSAPGAISNSGSAPSSLPRTGSNGSIRLLRHRCRQVCLVFRQQWIDSAAQPSMPSSLPRIPAAMDRFGCSAIDAVKSASHSGSNRSTRLLSHRCGLCMYACMHVCMYACMHVCMYGCMHVRMYACMHVCMYACMHVCMYASLQRAVIVRFGSAAIEYFGF